MGAYINFDLLDTAELCGLDIKSRTLAKEEVEARCPYCNDRRYRMYLNRVTHMFFCQNCGTGGNAVTLYADCNPKGIRLTNYESYKALSTEPSVRQYDVPIIESCDEPPIRELSERSEIYLEFLKLLRLEKDHLTNLLNRGLSTEIIKGNMYKSFPTDKTERQWICDNLAARYDLTDVPGFYRSGGRWSIIGLKSGILIPICSKDNFIQGLQIRFDSPPVKRITGADGKVTEKVGGRFRWLSTGGNGFTDGTGITSYIHVTGDVSSDTLYNSDHVDSVVQYLLDKMQAVKINIHGNLYFIPSTRLPLLNVLEDYIEALSKNNINDGNVSSNSMFVADDEKQREKMAAEFYMNYRRDIEAYEERIQHFIDNGCDSAAVIERWLKKIEALKLKKATYEQVLKRQLDDLDRDFALLQMQSQELSVRAGKNQIKMPLAA